jgi:hypothetical protein
MLLIDGVKYEEWTPTNEDEFEQVVKEHTRDIFSEQSIYLDRKQKLKSLSGIGSIPDGYVIAFGTLPNWHIVEVELSSHPLHDHIVSQVGRFISGMNNPNLQRGIVNAIDEEIARDDFLKLKLRKAIEPSEIYRFLSDLISKQPILTIIIDKDTEELREALNTLRYPQIKVVEFQTFTREGVGLSVHAHLFEPLYASPKPLIVDSVTINEGQKEKVKPTRRGTLQRLVDAKLVNPGQKIFRNYKGKRYEAEITATSKLRLLHDNTILNSLSGAAKHITGTEIDGWIWWYTLKDGQECSMNDLRKKLP